MDQKRHLVFRGGAGSGKSVFVVQKILFRILKDFGKVRHSILCIRKTQPAIRKSVFKLFLEYIDAWGLDNLCKVHNTNMVITFIDNSSIQCIGLDSEEKLKSIVGITSCWIEEATELSSDEARQVDLRLRGITASYKQICYTFNPVSKNSWLYPRFFEEVQDNVTLDHSTYKHNDFLDPEYTRMLENLINQSPTAYSIYSLGCWGSLDHVIYNNYRVIKFFPTKDMESIIYGIDFGFNVPSALIRVGMKNNDYYLDELIYESELTNAKLIKKIKLQYLNGVVYCDSASPERIAELKEAGINTKKAYKGRNSVKDGIDFIKRSKLYITNRSVNLLKEIGGYTYKQERDGTVLDEPCKYNDHAMDAMRYAIYTHFSKHKCYGAFI